MPAGLADSSGVFGLAGNITHLTAPLADGIVVDGTIRCPWYHARFDVQTGKAVEDGGMRVDDQLRTSDPAIHAIGDVPAQHVAVYFDEDGREQAVLTAGRDILSLEREHDWERR